MTLKTTLTAGFLALALAVPARASCRDNSVHFGALPHGGTLYVVSPQMEEFELFTAIMACWRGRCFWVEELRLCKNHSCTVDIMPNTVSGDAIVVNGGGACFHILIDPPRHTLFGDGFESGDLTSWDSHSQKERKQQK